jgi:rsbT co-antagonist protein RsbR
MSTGSVDPVVDLASLHGRAEELRSELSRLDRFFEIVFEKNPNGIVLALPDGTMRLNEAGLRIANATRNQPDVMGSPEPSSVPEKLSAAGIFRADKVTPQRDDELALARALRGEVVRNDLAWLQPADAPSGAWIEATAKPLSGGRALAIFRDVTTERELGRALAARNAELVEKESQNRDLVERLRLTLDALSTPVIEVADGVLALPLIGIVDTQRSATMTERLLAEVTRSRTRFVVIDLTGVAIVDTSTADRILKLARALSLLGVRCVVSGIQPPVAETLVAIGVDLDALVTERDLQHALEYCERCKAAP